jgi:hypothetical protein
VKNRVFRLDADEAVVVELVDRAVGRRMRKFDRRMSVLEAQMAAVAESHRQLRHELIPDLKIPGAWFTEDQSSKFKGVTDV